MISHAEYTALQEGAGFLDRSGRGRIRLTGADRRAYLHGQLTNDILSLSAGQGCYAALLTPQGRMISDMRVSELGDAILIDLPGETADAVRARLDELIFSEDVQVADARAGLAHAAVYGPRAADILAEVLSSPVRSDAGAEANGIAAARRDRLRRMPLNANATWQFGHLAVITVRSEDYGVPGFELFWGSDEGQTGVRPGSEHESAPIQSPVLLDALRTHGAVKISLETAHACRIEAGRPEFGLDMDQHTIPLEAGIEDRAISMTKGCYVGQEVIVRVLHRGHGRVARRLVGFVGEADAPGLTSGQRLLAGDESGKDIGVVTSAVVSPRLRRPIGLGYVYRDFTSPGTVIRASNGEGAAPAGLTIVPVPFTAQAG
jgi:folate-binding protein YgfZ